MGVVPKLRRLAVQTNVDNATTQRPYLVVDGYEALLLALTPYESKKTIALFFVVDDSPLLSYLHPSLRDAFLSRYRGELAPE